MLQIIREKTQGVFAWSAVVLIAATFTLWGANGYFSKDPNPIAAKVNNRKITWYEIENLFNQELQHVLQANKDFDLSQIDIKSIKNYIRRTLAQRTALLTKAEDLGFVISEKLIEENVRNNSIFHVNKEFSLEQYRKLLQANSISEAVIEKNLKHDLIINQMQQGLTLSSFALNNEVVPHLKLVNQRRDFGYTVIPFRNYLKNIEINDAAIADYYEENKTSFIAPEKVKISYLQLTAADILEKVVINDKDLIDYYEKNKASFTSPETINVRHILIEAPKGSDLEKSGEAREKISDIVARINLGEDFATLAKKYSDDKMSASNGGELGDFSYGSMVPEFEDTAFALQKPGQVSEIIQTKYGYHIIQLLRRQLPIITSFEDARTEVEKLYRLQEAETMLPVMVEELKNLLHENPDSLQTAAEKLNLQIKESDYFTKDGGVGVLTDKKVIQQAFSQELLDNKRNSDLIELSPESYIALQVVDHQASRPQALEAVRAEIMDYLLYKTAQEKAKSTGESLVTQLQAGNTPYKITQNLNLAWISKRNIRRDNQEIDPYILQEAFTVLKPQEEKPIAVQGFSMPNGDYLVLAISAVRVDNTDIQDAEQTNMHQKLEQENVQLENYLLQNALIKKSKIEYIDLP